MRAETVIVGGGPAGLACAKVLSEAGRDFILLERNSRIGPKVCAGGLTLKDLAFVDKYVLEKQVHRMFLNLPNGKRLSLSAGGIMVATINRSTLGRWQFGKISGSKSRILTNAAVTKIGEDYVIAKGRKISFKYLVGADGSLSVVRKYLGLPSERRHFAIQYIIPKEFPEMEWFLDQKLFSSGYGWIFPHKGYTSIGCCASTQDVPTQQLRKSLDILTKRLKIDASKARLEGTFVNYDYRGWNFGDMFLAGDAAGFASGLSAEGIFFAMASGAEVARTIINPDYKSKTIRRMLRIKRRHERILKIMRLLGRNKDGAFNLIGGLLANRSLLKAGLDFYEGKINFKL